MTRPLTLSALVLLSAGVPAAAAPPQPPTWSPYERSAGPDGAPSRCLQHRRGTARAGNARWYIFQVFNDCGRPVRAVCDIAYTPLCDYGRDVAVAAHLDAPVEPHGESQPFGHAAPPVDGGVPGCFFARCTEEFQPPARPGIGDP
ncbi:hypothetical protein R1A27_04610 [Methylobacterium sp. NMS12]|uniref:hypothetical protein n=1 Tax=Methylobacterium sp. NMS12 TaxID=3079766 RepID=UPI003F881C7D